MTDIFYDTYNGICANPNMVFGNLKFKLKKSDFDVDKDIIFRNMTKIIKNKEDMNEKDIYEDIMFLQTYEFNYDNVLEKLKEFYPGGIVEISDTMFIQLYLHLIINKNKRFIFKYNNSKIFEKSSYSASHQKYMDNGKALLFVMYYENYNINHLLNDVKCPYIHINLLKIGIDKNGFEVYSGITLDGIFNMVVIDWAKYLRQKCKEWLEENKKTSKLKYEKFSEIEKKEEKDIDEFMKGVELYSKKKNIDTLYKYFDIGYFDILEFSNDEIKLAINPVTELIVDIKN
jgi:hypothetical protein